MNRCPFFIFLCCTLFLTADISYAAGILMRVQQKKAMSQRQSQAQYQQYQLYQQQIAQGQQGQPGQQAPVKPTYQQMVAQRNQDIAQAIIDAHNPSVSSESSQTGKGNNAGGNSGQQKGLGQAGSTEAKDTVDLVEVWKKLDKKSTVWTLLIDDQAKILTVSEYLDRFHKEGVKINAPPMHYVQMIDQIVKENPEMLQRSFGELLQIAAIVEYDFDNGVDKDALARKVLGDAGFEQNKKRFSQQ